MKLLILSISILFLFSCDQNASKFKKKLSGTEVIYINYFKPNSNAEVVDTLVSVSNKDSIAQLISYFDGSKKSLENCDVDAQLIFFKRGMRFSDAFATFTNSQCLSLKFKDSIGQWQVISLSPEGKQFLLHLKGSR